MAAGSAGVVEVDSGRVGIRESLAFTEASSFAGLPLLAE